MEDLETELEGLKAILMNDAEVHAPNVSIRRVEYKLESCCISVEVEGTIIHIHMCICLMAFNSS